MLKLKFIKTMTLGVCLTLASSGAVYASEAKAGEQTSSILPAVASTMLVPDIPATSPAYPGQDYDPALLELQKEIDYFVFDQHRGEFADKGFSVTHTGPMGDYVEIGIQPYSEASAEYLYNEFGSEKIKVVEGQFAAPLAAVTGIAELQASVVSDTVDTSAEVSITSAEGEESKESSNALVYGLGAVVVLGAGAFGIKRLRHSTSA